MQPFKPDLPAGWTALHLPETDSTMSALRRQPASDAPFELFTADFQTAGHGQRGTVWEAERGQNLLFSFRFHPQFLPAARQFALSEALSLAIVRALRPLGVEATVKWPNDIYVGQRKLCGMLLEHTLAGNAIATTLTGVGVNVNQTDFQGDAPNPVSLRQLLGVGVTGQPRGAAADIQRQRRPGEKAARLALAEEGERQRHGRPETELAPAGVQKALLLAGRFDLSYHFSALTMLLNSRPRTSKFG